MARKKALVVGGTSGLGLEIAKKLQKRNFEITIVGRKDPEITIKPTDFVYRDLAHVIPGASDLVKLVGKPIELFVFAAGFYQEGMISQLNDEEIMSMIHVGLTAPISILNRILKNQNTLSGFIAITSTSQWIPRLLEPVYTAVKSGLAMFARSVSLDPAIGKTLLAAPAGMRTPFWKDTDRDTSQMLDPAWVAEQILISFGCQFKFKEIHILREPPRVKFIETR